MWKSLTQCYRERKAIPPPPFLSVCARTSETNPLSTHGTSKPSCCTQTSRHDLQELLALESSSPKTLRRRVNAPVMPVGLGGGDATESLVAFFTAAVLSVWWIQASTLRFCTIQVKSVRVPLSRTVARWLQWIKNISVVVLNNCACIYLRVSVAAVEKPAAFFYTCDFVIQGHSAFCVLTFKRKSFKKGHFSADYDYVLLLWLLPHYLFFFFFNICPWKIWLTILDIEALLKYRHLCTDNNCMF